MNNLEKYLQQFFHHSKNIGLMIEGKSLDIFNTFVSQFKKRSLVIHDNPNDLRHVSLA